MIDLPTWGLLQARWTFATWLERLTILLLAIHAVVFFIAGVSVLLPDAVPLVVFRVQRLGNFDRLETRTDREQLLADAEKNVEQALREELAEEALLPLFNEITHDLLDNDRAEKYWQELVVLLSRRLQKLSPLFDDASKFDRAEVEYQLSELRGSMCENFQMLVLREEIDEIRTQLRDRLDTVLTNLAATYRDRLREEVGQPIGKSFARILHPDLDNEQDTTLAVLERAGATVATLEQIIKDITADSSRSYGNLDRLSVLIDQNLKLNDRETVTKHRAEVKREQAKAEANAKRLDKAVVDLTTTIEALESDHPALSMQVAKLSDHHVNVIRDSLKKYAEQVNEGHVRPAQVEASVTLARAKAALTELRSIRSEVQGQTLKREVDQLARAVRQMAQATSKLDRNDDAVGRDNELSSLVWMVSQNEQTTEQLHERLDSTNKDTQLDTKRNLAEASETLHNALISFRLGATKTAERQLRETAKLLEAASASLPQPRQAVSDNTLTERALVWKLAVFHRKNLGPEVNSVFGQAVDEYAIPALVQASGISVGAARFDLDLSDKLNAVQEDLAKHLRNRLANVEPAECVLEGIELSLPLLKATPTPIGVLPKRTEQTFDRIARETSQSLRQQVTQVVQVGVLTVKVPKSSDSVIQLLERLNERQHQIGVKQRTGDIDPLGAGVLLIRARHQSRLAVLTKARDTVAWNVDAYRRFLKAIESRAHIQIEMVFPDLMDSSIAENK